MCQDLEATTDWLRQKGVEVSGEIIERDWGRMVEIKLPSGSPLHLYEPHHASPLLTP
jgi:hypothetical protein